MAKKRGRGGQGKYDRGGRGDRVLQRARGADSQSELEGSCIRDGEGDATQEQKSGRFVHSTASRVRVRVY